jgi:DNA-binding IclR family transcriptional regulator
MNGTNDRYKNLDDFSRILSLFEQQGAEERGVNEISRSLEMLPSKASRMLRKMETDRWLERSPRTGKYRIGARFLQIGLLYVLNHPLRPLMLPHLEQIAKEMPSFITTWNIFENDRVIVVDHLRFYHGPLIHLLGSDVPLHSSSTGKVFLAYLSDEEQDRVVGSLAFVRFTPGTITDPQAMREELKLIRARGYALDEEETREGTSSVSAPVLDSAGKMVAALTVLGESSAFSADKAPEIQYLREKGLFISRQLGYTGTRTVAS